MSGESSSPDWALHAVESPFDETLELIRYISTVID